MCMVHSDCGHHLSLQKSQKSLYLQGYYRLTWNLEVVSSLLCLKFEISFCHINRRSCNLWRIFSIDKNVEDLKLILVYSCTPEISLKLAIFQMKSSKYFIKWLFSPPFTECDSHLLQYYSILYCDIPHVGREGPIVVTYAGHI